MVGTLMKKKVALRILDFVTWSFLLLGGLAIYYRLNIYIPLILLVIIFVSIVYKKDIARWMKDAF
ncbi:hypothetical protein CMI38_02270 [Candidatus Pacearchaeota archaeon]|nr:hypothetical protein [Candidatus Pacearchaeota archaeon]|tara:strand:- start:800 stop:994 length:195 start_codon:yes stop_codon:yes gene_type:complete